MGLSWCSLVLFVVLTLLASLMALYFVSGLRSYSILEVRGSYKKGLKWPPVSRTPFCCIYREISQ
jgi:hypothetical protein